jgi:hypothetical protein
MYLDLLLFAFQKTDWAGDDDACSSYGKCSNMIDNRALRLQREGGGGGEIT